MTKELLKRDMIVGLCVVVLAILYLVTTPYQVSMRNDGFGVSGRSLPHLAGALGIIFGSWLALRNFILIKQQKYSESKQTIIKKGNTKRVFAFFGIMFVYFFAMQYLSFVISSILVLYVAMKFSGAKGQVGVIIISVLTPIFLYLIFSNLMSIPMPDTLFY